MKIKLVSYNAHNINDASNYNSFIPDDILLQGSARPIFVNRPERRPVYAGKILNNYSFPFTIEMLGTVSTQINTLKTWFDVEDMTTHKLIVKDVDDSDKQWYVMATTKSMMDLGKNFLTVVLAVADPVWYEDTESTDSWSITASGQTHNVTVAGNVDAAPRFVLTPTTVSGTGYGYKKLAVWRNPGQKKAMLNYPLQVCNAVWDTAALVAYTTNHVHINDVAGIDDSVTTIPVDNEAGTFPTSGLAYIETEQISYTGFAAGNITGVTRGVNDTTAAAHADNVQVDQSKIQADGDDIRVFIDGSEVNRWIYDMNTANTKVWINVNLQPGIDMTLGTAIANPETITTITMKNTKTNKSRIKKMPVSGTVLINSELFTYTGVSTEKRRLTGVTRESKGTSLEAHAVDDAVYWIENEIYVYYGNTTLGDPEDDDTDYDDIKPIIALTSTNTSWVYAEFMDDDQLRSGIWTPSVVKTYNRSDPDNASDYYTADADTEADPADDMGMSIKSFLSGSRWKAENAIIRWDFYHPAGITHVTAAGEKYRYTSKWPYARLKKNITGSSKKWVTVWTDVTPPTVKTWADLVAHSAVDLSGTYYYLRFEFSGTVGATANSVNYYEIESMTLALTAANVPQGTFNAEQSNYHIEATITNNTSGEYMEINTGMELNTALTIDCLNKKVYLADNTVVSDITFSSIRKDWLALSTGVNELQFDDTGTAALTFVTNWRDRNS